MEISAELVKKLRDKTGAGVLDCRNALKEAGGDLEKAFDNLRKMGIAKADSKSSRTANEGAVLSYIHPGNKLGVIIEINCETDFVARTDEFLNLAKEVSMQIAASDPIAVTRDEIPEELASRERKVHAGSKDLEGKPENMIDKIIDGKMDKWYKQVCLMEQAYIKEPSQSISDVIKASVGTLGENITISRFSRFQLGGNSKG